MSPVWNPAFDLGIGILLLYLWVKRRQRPYWQGFLGLPLMLALLTSLSAWAPKDTAWLFPWVTAAKLLAALALLALWTRLFVRIRWNMCSDWPYLLAGLFFLVLAYALSYLPSLPLPVAELQAQNSVLTLLSLLVLGFLHRQHLYLGRPALTVGIALLILATLFLFCWGYYQLPPEQMLEQLPYFRWVPLVLLSGILLLELNENRLRLAARQAELEAFEASQAQQFAHYQQTAAHLHQVRLVRHDIYNYIQAALYLSRDGTPQSREKAMHLIEQVYTALDSQEDSHEL